MNTQHHILLTCQSGLESLVRRESERLGLEHTTGQDRMVEGFGTLDTMMSLCMGSRFANRVYLCLAKQNITDFDTLFAQVEQIDWTDYINTDLHIIIDASSTRSELSSVPTIQGVCQKALFAQFPGINTARHAGELHVLILIVDNTARILLDVTGDALHKRGYRTEQGEAPIKETLAAGLVAMSGWKYRDPLWDPCAGSGTLAIEAVLMARNIAPGKNRHFRFMDLPFYDAMHHEKVKKSLEEKEFKGTYQIYASDRDSEMIAIAKRNALRAGVREDIHFEIEDFLTDNESLGLIVSNPPYGNRLQDPDLHALYTKLIHEVEKHGGGFITSYPVDVRHGLANKKLQNGNEECRFWYKKKI